MNASEKLKRLIDDRGITYTFISSRTGISIDAISRSLLGKRKLPADEFIAICNAANIDIREFESVR